MKLPIVLKNVMNSTRQKFSVERLRSVLLVLGILTLFVALLHPNLSLPRRVFDGLVIVDITQSMDTEDMRLAPAASAGSNAAVISRLNFAKESLIKAIPSLACGSKVGLGVFTEYRTLMLLEPVEVCENATDLQESVRNIEGRMAWAGNSEVAKGLYWALGLASKQSDKPAVVFITDGQEAPPINADNRLAYQGKVGEIRGVLAGVGGFQAQAIPKRDPLGRKIGVWDASEVNQINPYARGPGADPAPEKRNANGGALTNSDGATVSTMRTDMALLGATPGTEHLSALREGYLKLLAGEVGLGYARAQQQDDVLNLFSRDEVTDWKWRKTDLSAACSALALCLLLAYVGLGLKALPSSGKTKG
jgi:mxaL protein